MSQQQRAVRNNGDDDEELESSWPVQRERDADSVSNSDYDDELLTDIDNIIEDTAIWEQYVQKGGQ